MGVVSLEAAPVFLIRMADTATDKMVAQALALTQKAVGISEVTVDGQTTKFTDGMDGLNAAERRQKRRNGQNPTLARIQIRGIY